jgi:hypothetical protein
VTELAKRLLNRQLYKSIDIGSFGYDEGLSAEKLSGLINH